MLSEITLRRKLWRSDRIWTLPILNWRLAKKIPSFMDERALAQSQYWPREKLDVLRMDRLRHIVRVARGFSFWRDAFERVGLPKYFSDADFARIPIVTKKIFMSMEEGGYTAGDRTDEWSRGFTSGSTGRPFCFYLDRYYELSLFAFCERMFRIAAGGKKVRLVSLRSKNRIGVSLQKGGYMFFIRGYIGLRHRFDQLCEYLAAYPQGVVVLAFTSSLIEFARLTIERGMRLPIEGVVSGGEGVRESDRVIVREAFGKEIFAGYSTQELGWIGFECENHAIHINEEWAHVEIVDAMGAPVPLGERGRVIVTTFDNRIMPFIRYDTGDMGAIDTESCSCGRTLRTMRVLGRQVEYITFSDGRTVSLLDFSQFFDMYTKVVQQFQIVQTEEYRFTVKVVTGPQFDEFRDELALSLARRLHAQASVEWEVVETIPEGPNGKALYFISLERARLLV